MINLKPFILMAFATLTLVAQAQKNEETKAFFKGKVTSVEFVSSLASRSQDLIPFKDVATEAKDKRSIENFLSTNKDTQTEDDYYVKNRHEMEQSVKMTPASLVLMPIPLVHNLQILHWQ